MTLVISIMLPSSDSLFLSSRWNREGNEDKTHKGAKLQLRKRIQTKIAAQSVKYELFRAGCFVHGVTVWIVVVLVTRGWSEQLRPTITHHLRS